LVYPNASIRKTNMNIICKWIAHEQKPWQPTSIFSVFSVNLTSHCDIDYIEADSVRFCFESFINTTSLAGNKTFQSISRKRTERKYHFASKIFRMKHPSREEITAFAQFQKDLKEIRKMIIHPGVLCFFNIVGIITMQRKNNKMQAHILQANQTLFKQSRNEWGKKYLHNVSMPGFQPVNHKKFISIPLHKWRSVLSVLESKNKEENLKQITVMRGKTVIIVDSRKQLLQLKTNVEKIYGISISVNVQHSGRELILEDENIICNGILQSGHVLVLRPSLKAGGDNEQSRQAARLEKQRQAYRLKMQSLSQEEKQAFREKNKENQRRYQQAHKARLALSEEEQQALREKKKRCTAQSKNGFIQGRTAGSSRLKKRSTTQSKAGSS
jgi:hypothetical protein